MNRLTSPVSRRDISESARGKIAGEAETGGKQMKAYQRCYRSSAPTPPVQHVRQRWQISKRGGDNVNGVKRVSMFMVVLIQALGNKPQFLGGLLIVLNGLLASCSEIVRDGALLQADAAYGRYDCGTTLTKIAAAERTADIPPKQ